MSRIVSGASSPHPYGIDLCCTLRNMFRLPVSCFAWFRVHRTFQIQSQLEECALENTITVCTCNRYITMLEIIQNVNMNKINHTLLDKKSHRSITLVVTGKCVHESDNTVCREHAGMQITLQIRSLLRCVLLCGCRQEIQTSELVRCQWTSAIHSSDGLSGVLTSLYHRLRYAMVYIGESSLLYVMLTSSVILELVTWTPGFVSTSPFM